MFITNRMSPGEMLANLLDLRGYTEADTAEFARYKHNDHLCPRFRRNVDSILVAYDGYRANVHDIQSFTDDGADILLNYEDNEGQKRRVALQIKSYAEFEAGKGPKAAPLTTTLINQQSRATHNAGVDDYYIVLCTDWQRHRRQIRDISSAFKNYANVRIVTPEKALAFFKLTVEETTLRVVRNLCADDALLSQARTSIADSNAFETRFLIELTCRALNGMSKINIEDLISLPYSEFESGDDDVHHEERVTLINEYESGRILDNPDHGEEYTISIEHLPVALCALYFDQKCRHNPDDMVEHLFGLLVDEDEGS